MGLKITGLREIKKKLADLPAKVTKEALEEQLAELGFTEAEATVTKDHGKLVPTITGLPEEHQAEVELTDDGFTVTIYKETSVTDLVE